MIPLLHFRGVLAGSMVLLSAVLLSHADSLILTGTGGLPGESVSADLNLDNQRAIVGMQFDLMIPPGQAEAGGVVALDGMERHRVRSRVEPEAMKVVIHSPTNATVPDGDFLSIPLSIATGAPEGGVSFSIENLIFTDAAGKSVPGEVFYHPLEAWRQLNFTPEERADPEIIGDFKDPDGDGYTNIMEFLFSSNPLSADSPALARQSLSKSKPSDEEPGPVVFSFDYPQAVGADGVDLWIETSTDLDEWQRETVTAVTAGGDNGAIRRMRLSFESDPVDFPKRFYRLGVARNPDAAPRSLFKQPIPYEVWIARYYSGPDLDNEFLIGEQSDPDLDGMVNLMEYLFGSDPKVGSAAPLPDAGLVINGQVRTARLTYDVSREAEGVSLLIKASDNLQTWSPVNYVASPSGRSTFDFVEMNADIEGQAPARQFFQFEVQTDP
ncbi:hypothetical protein [Haloferula sp.]|uniref:hypothetical protein n=1 Tax=Haloferula sp. TaxID=2497595 RepID=UPI003C789607